MDKLLRARDLVREYLFANEHDDSIGLDDVYIVWFCYILGGWKALVSTTLPDDQYYEVTYDREKGRTYIDVYKKKENIVVPD